MQKLIDTLDKHFKKREEKTYSSNKLIHNLKDYYVNLARLNGEALELMNKFHEIDNIFDNYIPYVRHLDKYDFLELLKYSSHKVDDFFLGWSGFMVNETVNGWESCVTFTRNGVDIRFENKTDEFNPKVLEYSNKQNSGSALTPLEFEDKIMCFYGSLRPFTLTNNDFNDLYLLILRTIKKLKTVSDIIEEYTIDAVNEWVDGLKRDNLYGYNLYDVNPNMSES